MRSILSGLGYALIRGGFRAPPFPALAAYADKAKIADLMRRHRINCVLDVGANKGWFSAGLRRLGFEGDIFSFEPIRADHDLIAVRAEGDARWKTFNYALGETEEEREFNVVEAGGGQTVYSSFLEAKSPLGAVRKERASIRTIDALFASLPFSATEPRIFLKTDTQGYDLSVVRGARASMGSIHLLRSEIAVSHLYDGAPGYTEALAAYEGFGFRLIDLNVIARTADDFVLEFDCLMAKP